MTQRILVTGANGFVGRHICQEILAAGYELRAVVRRADRAGVVPQPAEVHEVGDLSGDTDWRRAVDRVDGIVHLAARVHQMHNSSPDMTGSYQSVNTDATLALGHAAAAAGVQRFVFVSTIKVNGETNRGHPFRAADRPDPRDPYSVSKFAAEQGLRAVSRSAFEAAIVRPTLIYGPGVRANFKRLMTLVDRGVPLPLGAVDNRRSLVSIWNLADLVLRLLTHDRPINDVFLVSDDEDVSTPELICRIAQAMGRPARLWSLPAPMLEWVGRLTGRAEEVRRLTESLQVDISATKAALGWTPRVSLAEGIQRTVAAFVEAGHVGNR